MSENRPLQFRSARTWRCLLSLAFVFAALLIEAPAFARNANAQWCFPQITWFGGNVPPVIDGTIVGDLGWGGAYRYIYDSATNGTPQNDVVMQGITDGNNVYFSFEVHKPGGFSNNDLIVIAFDPDGTAAHQQLFEINPVKAGQLSMTDKPAQLVQYWLGSSTFSGPSLQGASVPTWVQNLNFKLDTSDGPLDFLYTAEMQVPIDPTGVNGIPLPSATPFGMYLNVIRLDETNNTDAQASWPQSADPIGLDLVPPDASEWGTSSFTGLCDGVSVVQGSITDSITPAGTTGITLVMGNGNTNTFNVAVQNNTVSSLTGKQVLAPQIQPTFLISNFGINGTPNWTVVGTPDWTLAGPAVNPTPPQDIDPSSTANFSTGPWTIPTGSTSYNLYQSVPHQCIQVSLNALPPSTSGSPGQTAESSATCNVASPASPPPECSSASIIANAVVQNMNFGSVASGKIHRGFIAEVGTFGYNLPHGEETQVIDLWVMTQAYSLVQTKGSAPTARLGGSNISIGTGQNLLWTVHGYRHLGKFLRIHGKTYETVSYIGGFGYGLTYQGTNPQWRYQFFGENGDKLTSLDTNSTLYRIRVQQGKVGYVNVTFEGDPQAGSGGPIGGGGPGQTPPGKFAVFLDLGANFPQGTYSTLFNNGFSLNAGLEYMATSHFSAEGIFGYHYFSAKAGGSGNVYQFSADAKAYLLTGNLRPFINFGIGGYAFSPGSTHFGGNVGGGVLYTWSSRWGVQGSYNFHAVSTPANSTQFSTLQGGFRYVF